MKRSTADGDGDNSAQDSCKSEFITEWPPPSAATVERSDYPPAKRATIAQSGPDAEDSSSSDECRVDNHLEADAAVALAKFWRQSAALSSSSRIALVAQSAAGRKFLEQRAALLQRMSAAPSPRQAALLHALASALNFLGDVRRALQASAQAAAMAPHKRNYEWLRLKLERFVAAHDAACASWPAACPVACRFRCVQRLHCSQLTYRRFFEEFSMMRRPVIITGLQVTREPWSLDVIERHAAALTVDVKTIRTGSCEWAGLEVDRTTNVGEFIRSMRSASDAAGSCNERGYLFDWSLPQVCMRLRCSCVLDIITLLLQHCPALASQLIIPRYFACDLLQKLPPGCMYRVSLAPPLPLLLRIHMPCRTHGPAFSLLPLV